MNRSNVQVGRGCVARRQPVAVKGTTKALPPAKREDFRMATPEQAARLRQQYIDMGIIGAPLAAQRAA